MLPFHFIVSAVISSNASTSFSSNFYKKKKNFESWSKKTFDQLPLAIVVVAKKS